MRRSIVSLQPSGAFIEFSCQLGSLYRFKLDWNTTHGFFMVCISDSGGNKIVSCRALHVGVNIMDGINGFTGSLKIEGEKPNPYNLGVSCKLVWER